MEDIKNKMLKLKLHLHQPKKWQKHNWITDNDIDDYERAIYNDLDVTPLLERDLPDIDYSFLDNLMVEDEVYSQLEGKFDNYFITTYGRIINVKTKKTIKPTLYPNNISILLKLQLVSFKKEFIRLGWIYSQSFILEKYKEYKWRHHTVKYRKK
jgi:hypothetical protein